MSFQASPPVSLPSGFYWDEQLQLGAETAALTARVWPVYLVEDSDRPEPGLRLEITEAELARRFPVWGIRRADTGALAAYINAAVIRADLEASQLPDQGWRFAIQAAVKAETPNCLCLLVANVDPASRGAGLSACLLERAKAETRGRGLDTLIAPVRPLRKDWAPGQSEADSDPWINLHLRAGGEVVNVCAESVRVEASLGLWRRWTGLGLGASGEYELDGARGPLVVDHVAGIGVYREPNVWVRYRLGSLP